MENKEIRLNRLFQKNNKRAVITALDHGVTCGTIHGIENLEDILTIIAESSSDAVILHKGNIRRFAHLLPKNIGIIMHLSASLNFSKYANTKVLVASVEEAVRFGVDAVSMHINLGHESDREMLSDLGKVSQQCSYYGMPLLVMMYPDFTDVSEEEKIERIVHCIRLCEEMGVDIVKIPFMQNAGDMRKITKYAHIPVVMAGGENHNNGGKVLEVVKGAIENGLNGVSMGRNIFQSDDPAGYLEDLCNIVHNK